MTDNQTPQGRMLHAILVRKGLRPAGNVPPPTEPLPPETTPEEIEKLRKVEVSKP